MQGTITNQIIMNKIQGTIMRYFMTLAMMIVIAGFIFSCAATIEQHKIPKDPNYLFGTGVGESRNMQIAIDKATLSARTSIAQQIEIHIKSLQKQFNEEVGNGDATEINSFFSTVTKTIVSQTLIGSRVSKQDIKKKGDMHSVYALVEYAIGEANLALQNQIKKNRTMYQRFRASEAMQELDEEVQKYEEQKKNQY